MLSIERVPPRLTAVPRREIPQPQETTVEGHGFTGCGKMIISRRSDSRRVARPLFRVWFESGWRVARPLFRGFDLNRGAPLLGAFPRGGRSHHEPRPGTHASPPLRDMGISPH
jgi:hypothetical protein